MALAPTRTVLAAAALSLVAGGGVAFAAVSDDAGSRSPESEVVQTVPVDAAAEVDDDAVTTTSTPGALPATIVQSPETHVWTGDPLGTGTVTIVYTAGIDATGAPTLSVDSVDAPGTEVVVKGPRLDDDDDDDDIEVEAEIGLSVDDRNAEIDIRAEVEDRRLHIRVHVEVDDDEEDSGDHEDESDHEDLDDGDRDDDDDHENESGDHDDREDEDGDHDDDDHEDDDHDDDDHDDDDHEDDDHDEHD